MAKPPKKIPTPDSPDTHVISTRTENQYSPDIHNRPHFGRPTPEQGIDATTGKTPLTSRPNEATWRPAVEVTDMKDPDAASVEAARRAISWPRDKYDELTPFGENTGLFYSPDRRIYAEISDEGRFMVERNPRGEYVVPLPFAPGEPGPILAKIVDQPRWRIDRPGWMVSPQTPGDVRPTVDVGRSLQTIKPIPEWLANLLAKASEEDGIRYDKLGRAFVDTERDGVTHVRKNADGDYQATDFSERDPSGPIMERIEGTTLWRPKSVTATTIAPPGSRLPHDESGSRPAKRPRLDEHGDSDPIDSENLPVPQTTPAKELHEYSWLPWGHISIPSTGESVLLGGLHYRILPRGSTKAMPTLDYVFLLNPGFTKTNFEAFEHMLLEAPWLQPVATYRKGVDPFEVNPGIRRFDKPLSESVRGAFSTLSDLTCRAVAKKMFELADNSLFATTSGLLRLKVVLNQWQQKPIKLTPPFVHPVNMLPVVDTIEVAGKKLIPLLPESNGPLQRLNFDPQRFPTEWSHYLDTPSDYNLKRLVGALLIRSDYEVFPLTHEHRGPALVFKRPEDPCVYFLKLGTVQGDSFVVTHDSGNELASPLLPSRIGDDAFDALTVASVQNNVTWLIGGVHRTESGEQSVFILRER